MIQSHFKIKHFTKRKAGFEPPIVVKAVDDRCIKSLLERKDRSLFPTDERCSSAESDRVFIAG